MSGIEGAEREDYDECEAGVVVPASTAKASTTKVHEGKQGLKLFYTSRFDTWLRVCRIET
jgi:hypothetical protein